VTEPQHPQASQGPEVSLVVAVFEDTTAARLAVDELAGRGVAAERIHWNDPRPTEGLLEDQQEQGDRTFPTPPVAVIDEAQAVGAIGLGLLGTVVGAILALPLAALPFLDEYSLVGRLLVAASCGAFAGGAVGLVFGGARTPEVVYGMDRSEEWTHVRLDVEVPGERLDVAMAALVSSGPTSLTVYRRAHGSELRAMPGDPAGGAA
jgi:hypothetical protein